MKSGRRLRPVCRNFSDTLKFAPSAMAAKLSQWRSKGIFRPGAKRKLRPSIFEIISLLLAWNKKGHFDKHLTTFSMPVCETANNFYMCFSFQKKKEQNRLFVLDLKHFIQNVKT